MVDLCPNILYNNSKATFFLGLKFFDFDIYFIFSQNSCFHCALCGKVTAFLIFTKEHREKIFVKQTNMSWIH